MDFFSNGFISVFLKIDGIFDWLNDIFIMLVMNGIMVFKVFFKIEVGIGLSLYVLLGVLLRIVFILFFVVCWKFINGLLLKWIFMDSDVLVLLVVSFFRLFLIVVILLIKNLENLFVNFLLDVEDGRIVFCFFFISDLDSLKSCLLFLLYFLIFWGK